MLLAGTPAASAAQGLALLLTCRGSKAKGKVPTSETLWGTSKMTQCINNLRIGCPGLQMVRKPLNPRKRDPQEEGLGLPKVQNGINFS